MQDDPGSVAALVADRLLYGEANPYARPAIGTVASVESIGLEDARGACKAIVDPAHATLLVAGNLTADEAKAALNRALGDWKSSAKAGAAGDKVRVVRDPGDERDAGGDRRSPERDPDRGAFCRTRGEVRRSAAHAAADAQHHPRRLVHQPPQPEPARRARVHLRRSFVVDHGSLDRRLLGRRAGDRGQDRSRRSRSFSGSSTV